MKNKYQKGSYKYNTQQKELQNWSITDLYGEGRRWIEGYIIVYLSDIFSCKTINEPPIDASTDFFFSFSF